MGAGGVELELLAFTVGDTASQVFAVAQNAHLIFKGHVKE